MTSTNAVAPPANPETLPAVFAEAFNNRDLPAVESLFEPDAMHVVRPGETIAGRDRSAALPAVLHNRIPIEVVLRQVYVVGDLALLINDYVHDGVAADGSHVHIEGTATDIAHRGADGGWRYVISNPSGIS